MVLVGYSDSEESDNEKQKQTVKPKLADSKPLKPNKTTITKLVDKSEPNKIRVNLASLTTDASTESANDDGERPAKKARTGGGFMGGFNALLPTPKNRPQPKAQANGITKPVGRGLGSGVNLKTGSAASFSRGPAETVATKAYENDPAQADENAEASIKKDDEVKLIGKATMFRPLSVARNPQNKSRPPSVPKVVSAVTTSSSPQARNPQLGEQQKPSSETAPKAKAKLSLFSTYTEPETAPYEAPKPTQDFNDINNPDDELLQSEAVPVNNTTHAGQAQSTTNPADQSTQTLASLADTMNLSAADRRRLFGRHGERGKAAVASFNLQAEYSHNNELIAKGEAVPTANPVRAITSGKHSLQQLVNHATSQKDALEESFSRQKNNQREAGARYGF